jgi:hypothetical protein
MKTDEGGGGSCSLEELGAAFDAACSRLGPWRAFLALSRPSHIPHITCVEVGGDPDRQYIDWGARMENHLGVTLPGNWDTPEGREERKHALLWVTSLKRQREQELKDGNGTD